MISSPDTGLIDSSVEREYEVRQIQVTEKMVKREHSFIIGFSGQFMTVSWTENLQFILTKLRSV
jgi:hypothetical protein